jgi:hypothetical protein
MRHIALINPQDPENIYNESGWTARRKEAREWRDAFTAREILEAVDELPDDLGEEQPKYPIGVSLIQVFAETHRDVLFGIPPSTDVPPVSILLTSDDDQYKALCDEYQKVIARVLYQSKAASLFMRAGLMMQVLGGWAFKVTAEPHARHLKYQTRIIGLEPEMIEPTYDLDDVWRLRECLIGYLISAEDARNRYGIEPRKGKTEVVYLEYWTESEFRIVVDNRVPSVPGYGPFEGAHQIGRTPIVYVPHIPDRFWGMSHAAHLITIEHEMNDRLTDKGDVADESSIKLRWPRTCARLRRSSASRTVRVHGPPHCMTEPDHGQLRL